MNFLMEIMFKILVSLSFWRTFCIRFYFCTFFWNWKWNFYSFKVLIFQPALFNAGESSWLSKNQSVSSRQISKKNSYGSFFVWYTWEQVSTSALFISAFRFLFPLWDNTAAIILQFSKIFKLWMMFSVKSNKVPISASCHCQIWQISHV